MNELIPITTTIDGKTAVSGRALHAFLELGRDYTTWFKQMTTYGLSEGSDYVTVAGEVSPNSGENLGGRPRIDHVLTLDAAKEIAMIQRTDRGKQARAYFIGVEKQYRAGAAPALSDDQIVQQALAITARRVEALEQKVAADAPKVEAFDAFLDADGAYSIGNTAKMLGISRTKLFDRLRAWGVLIAKGDMRNTPYQRYMHHFRVTAYTYSRDDGSSGTSYTTKVLSTGVDFIRMKLALGTETAA